MRKFSDMGIKVKTDHFTSDKVKVNDILNMEIVVLDYKIQKSKFDHLSSENCLWMQIEIDNVKHVLFTGSRILSETLKQVPESEFPFSATIKRVGKSYQFI